MSLTKENVIKRVAARKDRAEPVALSSFRLRTRCGSFVLDEEGFVEQDLTVYRWDYWKVPDSQFSSWPGRLIDSQSMRICNFVRADIKTNVGVLKIWHCA